jgi:hypothetical protein
MKDIYIYDNPILNQVYLQDGPNWEKRKEFADVRGLVNYLNGPEATKIRGRSNIAVCLSGERVAELEDALKQVKFRKAPDIQHREPPKTVDKTPER